MDGARKATFASSVAVWSSRRHRVGRVKEFWKTWHLAANWKLRTDGPDGLWEKSPLQVCGFIFKGLVGVASGLGISDLVNARARSLQLSPLRFPRLSTYPCFIPPSFPR